MFGTLRFILLLVAAVLLAACSGDDDNASGSDTITVGVVQSLAGSGADYGKTALQGIELAVEELNAAGELPRIELEVLDDESDVQKGVEAFETLGEQDVVAIIGPTLSNVALEAQKVAQEQQIPVLAATNTADGITDIGDFIFRVALTESVVVPATLARVAELEPIENAVLVVDSSDAFSVSSAEAMKRGVQDIGATIVAEVDVASGNNALAGLAGVDVESVDAVLITPLAATSGPILKALRAAGYDGLVVGGNSFNTPDIVTTAGDAIEGVYVGAAWNPDVESEAGRSFVTAYSEAYGAPPDLFAAQGYAAVRVLADALERAESTEAEDLRAALAETEDVTTPLGVLSFSEQRDAVYEPVVQVYRDGQLTVVP